ncbi:DNA polymerase III subunit epsilon [Curvivirga sp.]|uniref:DNA polymerase III subunit epsilon n=1 Tax=Curvivirga sp. TaxID=2856848 RepID=UPI003B5AA27E
MREIVLDTETTGFDPFSGDRIVEIGCVELVNRMPTGEVYHQYINPERDMPEGAFQVHGLSEEFLADFPTFREVGQAFLDFIGDGMLVIHNAAFDMKFLNAELEWMGLPKIPMSRSIDTLAMARAMFPGAQATLDALCRRFDIDNTSRTYHGALLDSELLADVYLELTGGRQPGLELAEDGKGGTGGLSAGGIKKSNKPVRPARPHKAHDEELVAHAAFLDEKVTDPIWNR